MKATKTRTKTKNKTKTRTGSKTRSRSTTTPGRTPGAGRKVKRKLDLAVELVPEGSWYRNIRRVFSEVEWKAIRARALAECGHRCAVCGAGGELRCNPMWEFEDRKRVQKLAGFTVLCSPCHLVWHLDEAEALAERGQVDMERIVRHFMRVNRCRRSTYERHRAEALAIWRRRSRKEWNVDLGEKSRFADPPQPEARLDSDWLERQITSSRRSNKRSRSESRDIERWLRQRKRGGTGNKRV